MAVFSGVLVSALVAICGPAAAAQVPGNCGPHTEVIKALADKFGESQSATALTNSGGLIEVLTANDGSTWSIVVSRPDGLSCIVAVGQHWQDRAAQGEISSSY